MPHILDTENDTISYYVWNIWREECSDGSREEAEKPYARSYSSNYCFESINPVCGSLYFKDPPTMRETLKFNANSENVGSEIM